MPDIERRIREALRNRFPNRHTYRNHFGELLIQYAKSGLGQKNLVSEIETADEGRFQSYVWEAMLYRYLCDLGYELLTPQANSEKGGPDFCVNYQGQKIWIEAVVPSPEGIPREWLNPPTKGQPTVRSMPDKERVLRCTSAIKDKKDKFVKYKMKNIVGKDDFTVIAVNICRLSDYDIDGRGISQLPLVMEALFHIGRLAAPITPEGKPDGPLQHIPRYTVKKANGRDVETGLFLDKKFLSVSAVIQGHQKDMHERPLILSVVHNPRARTGLPTGLFGAHKEFVAEDNGDEYIIQDILDRNPAQSQK